MNKWHYNDIILQNKSKGDKGIMKEMLVNEKQYNEIKGLIADAVGDVTGNEFNYMKYMLDSDDSVGFTDLVGSVVREFNRLALGSDEGNPEWNVHPFALDTYVRIYLYEMYFNAGMKKRFAIKVKTSTYPDGELITDKNLSTTGYVPTFATKEEAEKFMTDSMRKVEKYAKRVADVIKRFPGANMYDVIREVMKSDYNLFASTAVVYMVRNMLHKENHKLKYEIVEI